MSTDNPLGMAIDAGVMVVEGQPVALILNGRSRIEVNDFVGSADARVNDDGTMDISIQGRPRRGKRNEDSVLKILRTAVALASKADVVIADGDDSRGEDGALQVGPDTYVIQIVTVPMDQEYGKRVASGNFQIRLTPDIGADWIHDAIQHKLSIPPADRPRTILALDARHVAVLSDTRVLREFDSKFPGTSGLGFAQIWLVGPLTERSVRIS